jgi:hypothetical protein
MIHIHVSTQPPVPFQHFIAFILHRYIHANTERSTTYISYSSQFSS